MFEGVLIPNYLIQKGLKRTKVFKDQRQISVEVLDLSEQELLVQGLQNSVQVFKAVCNDKRGAHPVIFGQGRTFI